GSAPVHSAPTRGGEADFEAGLNASVTDEDAGALKDLLSGGTDAQLTAISPIVGGGASHGFSEAAGQVVAHCDAAGVVVGEIPRHIADLRIEDHSCLARWGEGIDLDVIHLQPEPVEVI